jgi:hypothetical protein
MHNANQDSQRAIRKAVGPVVGRPETALKPVLTTARLLLTVVWVASAANVALKSKDALGTSSVTGSMRWSDGAVPSSGNTFNLAASLATIQPTNNLEAAALASCGSEKFYAERNHSDAILI